MLNKIKEKHILTIYLCFFNSLNLSKSFNKSIFASININIFNYEK
ncbi:hypothetical protein BFO_0439 [Tannerella forsythia 92A2]|uniref:Uncharacterized protein n=1 Tax=Tannerella forsythia (strain ATCC 43037 / JCM 10827 / CCUG 21028 A / KCTC 5666 / FDC 338) TaxID=203275 RepID=G8UKU8_TANFA|nr:hypothetical protein BFO_0439 [Tannerella forsythia 92A2]